MSDRLIHCPDSIPEYDIPVVGADEIEETCNFLSSYLPMPPDSLFSLKFWEIAWAQVKAKSPLFWMSCALVLAVCALLSRRAFESCSPVIAAIVLSPVPFLSFIIDTFHSRDQGVMDIEMTCRYDARQLYFAKLFIGLLMNIVMLYPMLRLMSPVFSDGWRLIVSGLFAMFLAGFAAMWVVGISNKSSSLPVLLSFWVILGAVAMSMEELVLFFENVSLAIVLAALPVSLALFALKLKSIARNVRRFSENGGF